MKKRLQSRFLLLFLMGLMFGGQSALQALTSTQEKRLNELKQQMRLTDDNKVRLAQAVNNRIGVLEVKIKRGASSVVDDFGVTLSDELGYPANTRKETLQADLIILRAFYDELAGGETHWDSGTPAPAAETLKEFIQKVQDAKTDHQALELLQARASKDFFLEPIDSKSLFSWIIDKKFFDSATWLVNQGAPLNTIEPKNDSYTPFLSALDMLNNPNLLSKAKALCELMISKGGDIAYARQSVLKDSKPCMAFLDEHDKPKDTKKESSTSASPEEADECPICFENMTTERNLATLTCNHTFCKKCIDDAFKTKKECPICRRDFGSKDPFKSGDKQKSDKATQKEAAPEQTTGPKKEADDTIKKVASDASQSSEQQEKIDEQKIEKEIESPASEDDAQEECSICMDEMTPEATAQQSCSHSFHRECIDKWLEDHTTCPLCRAEIKQEDLVKTEKTTTKKQSRRRRKESQHEKKNQRRRKKKKARKKKKVHSYKKKNNKKIARRKRQERRAHRALRRGEKNKNDQVEKSSAGIS